MSIQPILFEQMLSLNNTKLPHGFTYFFQPLCSKLYTRPVTQNKGLVLPFPRLEREDSNEGKVAES